MEINKVQIVLQKLIELRKLEKELQEELKQALLESKKRN
jgi:hypothetical protein